MKLKYKSFRLSPLIFLMVSNSTCSQADSILPNSSNPAHCLAAYNAYRQVALNSKPPLVSLAVQMTARGIFEGNKLKSAGTFESSKSESEKLLNKYASNWGEINKLAGECMKNQDNDKIFKSHELSILKMARKVDPACSLDEKCKNL